MSLRPPAMAKQRTIVLADLHLTRRSPRELGEDLACLLAAHPGARVLCAGDFFDFVIDEPHAGAQAVSRALGAHPAVRAALGTHLERGGALLFAAGNHDAAIADDAYREALVEAIGAGPGARDRLDATPWFSREGGLHVEHGHVYDPDNTPAHPLVVGAPSLGVLLGERFVGPARADEYLQAADGTPLASLGRAWRWYGPRAPAVVHRYFRAAFAALLRSGPFFDPARERELGRQREQGFARRAGVPVDVVAALLALRPRATLASARATAARLYMDRVLGTAAVAAGLAAAALGHRRAGQAAALAGAVVLAASWLLGRDRYHDAVAQRLARAAAGVARATGAKLVVFGHAHREALASGYANTGSFGFPQGAPGRPYLEIEGSAESPRAVRRYLERSG